MNDISNGISSPGSDADHPCKGDAGSRQTWPSRRVVHINRAKLAAGGRITLFAFLVPVMAGCESMALTAFGVGASTGVQHTLGGMTYRTFTLPAPTVKTAAIGALGRMGIKVSSTEKTEVGEMIKASTAERQIELEIEKISPNSTRLRAVVKNGSFLYDGATATEIIMQTEKLLLKV